MTHHFATALLIYWPRSPGRELSPRLDYVAEHTGLNPKYLSQIRGGALPSVGVAEVLIRMLVPEAARDGVRLAWFHTAAASAVPTETAQSGDSGATG